MNVQRLVTVLVYCLIVLGSTGLNSVEAAPKVVDFELEIELNNHTEFDMEYEVKNHKIEAKYSVPGSATTYGQEAQAMIEPFMNELNLSKDSNKEELKKLILSILEVNPKDVDEFELEVKFDTGEKIKIDQ